MPRTKRLALTLLVLLLVGSAAPVPAQCSMCKTAVTGSEEGRSLGSALNNAILLLLFVPYGIGMTAGFVFLRKHARSRGTTAGALLKSSLRTAFGRSDS